MKAATFLLDQRLTKAELIVEIHDSVKKAKQFALEMHFNPSSIKVSRSISTSHTSNINGGTTKVRPAAIKPLTLTLPSLRFDTYENRKSVRTEVIERLEDAMVAAHDKERRFALVRLNWGMFCQADRNHEYTFILRGLDVNYTMFLPDGTPVRAEVSLQLEQYLVPGASTNNASRGSDAQTRVTKLGDSVQAIATEVYGDPRRWREICDANKIDDPMNLTPGRPLLIPPKRAEQPVRRWS